MVAIIIMLVVIGFDFVLGLVAVGGFLKLIFNPVTLAILTAIVVAKIGIMHWRKFVENKKEDTDKK